MSLVTPQVIPTDLAPDSYVVMGVATCYLRQEGETLALEVMEPIPSAYLETLLQGTPTAYRHIWGTHLEAALACDPTTLTPTEGPAVQRCADFEQRLVAAARTYQSRPQATTDLPIGTHRQDLNYSTAHKRILNPKNKVSKADNVKQHKYTHEVL
ncbi:hypothetical protein GFS31_04730 [Leptolyngbya sp. BL0902]|uniref:hypothetical protein n=1 Tax=Leptolyngbya sp. BL0902 TaxID=1115757 RepID=UPI0018E6EE6A|nr:hypothetical protein [Leptolyngbya sp. BL0902]QQE63803.1 hypothetical protein GFS31_04730 [Leptolyngbya sp. BL0902]